MTDLPEPTSPTVPQGAEIDALIEQLRVRRAASKNWSGSAIDTPDEALWHHAADALARLRPAEPISNEGPPTGSHAAATIAAETSADRRQTMTAETPTREIAKAVRDKLCIEVECTFDDGCFCMDAITAALDAQSAGMRERVIKVFTPVVEYAAILEPQDLRAARALLVELAQEADHDR
jgi:hypothetical protein